MKITKKILYFFALFLIVPLTSKAASTEIVGIESIINVSKNRVANVDEKIDLYIIDETDEFKKYIDKKAFYYRKDGSKIHIESKITNIDSKNLKNISKNNNQEIVHLKLDGEKDTIETINLKYDYNLGRDISKKYDEFYYNIVNNDNIASNIVFEITLPEDAKINNIDFAINDEYKLSTDDVTYTIENNVITGYLNILLNENEKFTIRIELPNNYFKNVADNFNYLFYLYLVFPIITLFVIICYWWKYARKNKFRENITINVPSNFDPVEIAYLYKGFVDENDLATNILFLANNGYLKIEENEDGYKLGTENTFKFIKVKDYDKNNAIQKLLFEGIFKEKEISELKDIEYGYSSKIIDTKKMIDNSDNKLRLFNIDIKIVRKTSLILLAISTILLNIEPTRQLTNSYLFIPLTSFFMIFGLSIMFIMNVKGIKKLFGVLLYGTTIIVSIYTLLGQTQLLMIYIIEVILVLLGILLYRKIPVRTLYGNKKLAEINAFRIGLLSMNINELEEHINDNSNYFYDMMPYVIVLGITDEWLLKGKTLVKEKPYWHITKEEFMLNKEIRFFKNVIYTTSKVMIKAIYAKKESSQLEFKKFK